MSRRKIGRKFSSRLGDAEMAKIITAAIREDFGQQASAVKEIAQITGARTPTVTNWYQGKNLPGSIYLLRLARTSPSILRFVLIQIGGELLVDAYEMFSRRTEARPSAEFSVTGASFPGPNVSENVSMEARGRCETSAGRRRAWFLEQLKKGTAASAKDIAETWHVDIRTAWRDIDQLKETNQIWYSGSRRSGHYCLGSGVLVA